MAAHVVPYLKVYKDGSLVDTICLQGQDCWVAGRHAQCDIVVGHASTSRRHLEIQVVYATRELLLTDLQSAHGTMVNGEAVASSRVMHQGDTLQMGASTRSYKVEWVEAMERSASSKARFNTQMKSKAGEKQAKGTPSQLRGAWRTELPPRTPVRRLPFANVPASTLNSRSPQGPGLRKSNTLPDKITMGADDKSLTPTSKEAQHESGLEGSAAASSLWIRRCSSAPMPTVVTPLEDAKETEDEIDQLPVLESAGREHPLPDSLKSLLSYDEYPSDKENHQPENDRRKSLSSRDHERQQAERCCSPPGRLPFAELPFDMKLSSPDTPDFGSRTTLGLPPPQREQTSAMVNNLDSLFGNLKLGGGCRWHLVVDTNCLLDADALKALKQLEGIRETRVIIPRIVLRELDGLKKRHDLGLPARVALRWVEECMEKKPSWMHVQSSTETRPSRGFSSNDDQILDCALLFDRELVHDGGRIVLLTRDTALKIKAMAEGMTVHDAASFCESLLSPYSERFLWLGRPTTITRSRSSFTGYSESYGVAAAAAASPFSIQPPPKLVKHQLGIDEFRCRPQGLKALLA